MNVVLVKLISLSLVYFLHNYTYASTQLNEAGIQPTNEDQIPENTSTYSTDSSDSEDIVDKVRFLQSTGVLVNPNDQEINKETVVPSQVNSTSSTHDSIVEQPDNNDSVVEQPVNNDSVVEKTPEVQGYHKTTLLDEIIDTLTEKSEDEFLNMSDEYIRNKIRDKRIKRQNPKIIAEKLESFLDSQIKSGSSIKKSETDAGSDSDSKSDNNNTDLEPCIAHKEKLISTPEYDNQIVESLREIGNDYIFKPTADYVPVSKVLNVNTNKDVSSERMNNSLNDKETTEIKSVVQEILGMIRETSTISKTQTETIQNFIDHYLASNDHTSMINNLVALINNLEKTKFPFSPDDDFLKHNSDKNPEAITYSDIYENKWTWKGGDNSVDNFNTTIEKKISGDYRKNNMVVRFHKVIRDNKISDIYEEVIGDSPEIDTVSSNKDVEVPRTGESIISEQTDTQPNGSSSTRVSQCILIPVVVITMFIL